MGWNSFFSIQKRFVSSHNDECVDIYSIIKFQNIYKLIIEIWVQDTWVKRPTIKCTQGMSKIGRNNFIRMKFI